MPTDEYKLLEIGLINDTETLNVGLSEEETLTVKLATDVSYVGDLVHYDTTAHWNAQTQLIAQKGHVYVYSDYMTIDDQPVAGFKVGDGTSYLIDMPFAAGNSTLMNDHINNSVIHVTAEDKEFWNNKVTCFMSAGDTDHLIFTKESEENYNG